MKKNKKRMYIAKAKEPQSSKFNSKMSVSVSVSVSKLQENVVVDLAQRSANEAIRACALHYGFSADEALGLLNLSVVRSAEKVVAKKSKSKKSVAAAVPKLPIPFSGELIEGKCHGLKHNHGLFTQCYSQLAESESESESLLCVSCLKQASKNTSGNPDCGRIESRLSADLFDFRDPKGRKPVALTTVMKKMNLSRDQIEADAAHFNITINPIHFEIPKANNKAKKANTEVAEVAEVAVTAGGGGDNTPRGRPKKASKTPVVDATEDLFATLVSQAVPVPSTPVAVSVSVPVPVPSAPVAVSVPSAAAVEEVKTEKKKSAPKKISEEAKAVKAEKATALALAKAEKATALALATAEKEAKKNALALAKAEKEATIALAKAEKEAAKLAKAEKKPTKKAVVPVPVPVIVAAVNDDEESEEDYESAAENEDELSSPIDVEEFVHKGTTYLKTQDNVIYSQEQELVGHWNEETQEIDICDESDSDEDEDEEEEEEEEEDA